MILVQVISIWLGIVCIAVALDVLPSYFSDRAALKEAKKAEEKEKEFWQKSAEKPKKDDDVIRDASIRGALIVYRNMKRIEFGLEAAGARTSVERKRGIHRRVEAA